jgi:hypothetical protein
MAANYLTSTDAPVPIGYAKSYVIKETHLLKRNITAAVKQKYTMGYKEAAAMPEREGKTVMRAVMEPGISAGIDSRSLKLSQVL